MVTDLERLKRLEKSIAFVSQCRNSDLSKVEPSDNETAEFLEDWKEFQKAMRKFHDKHPWVGD